MPARAQSSALRARAFGRREGFLYETERLRKLDGYLKKRGFRLLLEEPYLYGYNCSGAFDGELKDVLLKEDATCYEVWHEMSHYRHYQRIGKEAYLSLDQATREQVAFGALKNNPRRWNLLNPEEHTHAELYLQRKESGL